MYAYEIPEKVQGEIGAKCSRFMVIGMALALLLAAPVMLPQMETQAKEKTVMLNKETATLHLGDKLAEMKGTKHVTLHTVVNTSLFTTVPRCKFSR